MVHHHQKVEIAHPSVGEWVYTHAAYTDNGIPFSKEKECTLEYTNVDEPKKHYISRKKSDGK